MLKKTALLLAMLLSTSVFASEAKIKATLEKEHPELGKITAVNPTSFSGLYEIVGETQLFYTNDKAQFLIGGALYDLKTMRNLTDERSKKLFAVDFKSLPLSLAVKRVKGRGERKMAYFTDPNCGYCKKLEQELVNVDNVTLYAFLYPVFPGSDEKVRRILCSKNPAKTWEDVMLNGVQPSDGAACQTETERVLALGQKHHVTGTPTIIFADGQVSPGYMPAAELEKALNAAAGR
jgi:thiol:disulfide interchange protein DsbC